MNVPQILEQIRNDVAAIGCRVHFHSQPHHPDSTVIVIIPDHPMAIERFEHHCVFDGIGVHVRTRDLDKTRSNSNYFRELTNLLKLFGETRPRLRILADAVSNVDPQDSRLSYAQALSLADQKIKALDE